MSDNWQDDIKFKKQIAEYAREDYEKNKDNPYAAVGYANVIVALYGRQTDITLPEKAPDDHIPKWVKAVRRTMKAAFGTGNGRVKR